jgi:hypothetical protein
MRISFSPCSQSSEYILPVDAVVGEARSSSPATKLGTNQGQSERAKIPLVIPRANCALHVI